MVVADDLLQMLRTWGRMPAGDLLTRLGVSRATMMRAIQSLGDAVAVRGKARKTSYAARRAIRGSRVSIPVFRINERGQSVELGKLDPLYPQGCALTLGGTFEWPVADAMADGWFEGIPYPMDDMRPQGFLGRNFARQYAAVLQVTEDPTTWSEDDVLHALSILGADTPGNYILGEGAYRRFLAEAQEGAPFLKQEEVLPAYLELARKALEFGVGGSSAGGEFPKFTARRLIDGEPVHVLVKFSGDDASSGTQRWSDLLVCEHLALETVRQHLGIDAATSRIYQAGGRTFLEVDRFDRHGKLGRSGLCSWSALNAALFGLPARSWVAGAAEMRRQGWLLEADERDIQRIWHFGLLIGNTDMHDGNLSFRPGLALAPVYDMLPMHYAPLRGVELPERPFTPQLPLPGEAAVWHESACASVKFWEHAASDARISDPFRQICAENAAKVRALAASPVAAIV